MTQEQAAIEYWEAKFKQQEYRNTAQCDRIAILEAQNKQQADRIAELEGQLGFIVSINRAGLGVVDAVPMSSEKREKIWNAIEEQKDDNFHYGWKKCEQYYGFSDTTPQTKPLSDEEIIDIWLPFATTGITGKIAFARAIEERILGK